MNNENKKVISIRLIYILPIIAMIIAIVLYATKNFSIKTEQIAKNSEQEEINVASINREEKIETTSRSEEITRNNDELQNENLQAENNEGQKEEVVVEEQKAENTNEEQEENKYISIKDVKISKDMDLTVRTGLSRADFITLISGVKADTSGFFEENAGTIYDLCEEYSLNEIFFCGIISAESGWDIASNHRKTHNYISLMSNGKLISYSSVESGLREAAKKLHTNYLTKGGKFYYGKTLTAVKTKFCPASSTWVSLVYGRMSQIIK